MASFLYFILFQFKVEHKTSSTELISLCCEDFKHRLGVDYHSIVDKVESWCCLSCKLDGVMWLAVWQDVVGIMDVKKKCVWALSYLTGFTVRTEEKITTVGTDNYTKKVAKNVNI